LSIFSDRIWQEKNVKLTGSEIIPASRAAVWKGLNSPNVLKQCIPGCESITQDSPTNMKAKVVVKIGPVKASFTGVVTLSELNPPESYRISGKGQGGLAGFASGGARVKLTELGPSETRLDYDVDAQIGGKLAMLGSRLVDSTAKSYATQFFTKFASVIEKEAPVARAEGPAAKKALAKKTAAKKSTVKKAAAKRAPPKTKSKKS
jgi:carbon monoxide dehydrogenase subunit G